MYVCMFKHTYIHVSTHTFSPYSTTSPGTPDKPSVPPGRGGRSQLLLSDATPVRPSAAICLFPFAFCWDLVLRLLLLGLLSSSLLFPFFRIPLGPDVTVCFSSLVVHHQLLLPSPPSFFLSLSSSCHFVAEIVILLMQSVQTFPSSSKSSRADRTNLFCESHHLWHSKLPRRV